MKLASLFRKRLHAEGGFSLAEVMVSGMIMVMAMIPLVGMFDGAFNMSQMAYDKNLMGPCAEYFAEMVRSTPFYIARSPDLTPEVNQDMDDFYWGDREPENLNTWSDAAEVVLKAYDVDPYPEMMVAVKMIYVDDRKLDEGTIEDAAASMDGDWGPKRPGHDKPMTSDGVDINLIFFQVKVTSRYIMGGEGRTAEFTVDELYANPVVTAHLYIDRVVNVGGAGTEGTRFRDDGECFSAPNNVSTTVEIYGSGFESDPAMNEVSLVSLYDADIPVSITSVGQSPEGQDVITGTIDLASGGYAGNPWHPRHRPGYWSAIIRSETQKVASIKNSVFVVEYPVPQVSGYRDSSGDRLGSITSTDETIILSGAYIIQEEEGGGSAEAVVQLMKEDDPDLIITNTSLSVTKGGSFNRGYEAGLTATAHFNMLAGGAEVGRYRLRVINCINRNNPDPEEEGNTWVEAAGTYEMIEMAPQPDEVYVEGSSPRRHFGYKGRTYTYRLRIAGENFVDGATVKLGRGYQVPPAGDLVIDGADVQYIDSNNLVASFDLNVPDGHLANDYWVYVQNPSGMSGTKANVFGIRQPRPVIYNVQYVSGPGGFYHNYHSIQARLEGECFDVSYPVKYESGDPGGGAPVTTYVVGVDDGGMTKSVEAEGTVFNAQLNLIHVATGNRRIWVENGAGENDDLNPDPVSGQTYAQTVNVVTAAPILNPQASGAVTITNRKNSWGRWYGPKSNTEDAATKAQAQRSVFLVCTGYATFTLRGQGFKDANVGTTNVKVYNFGAFNLWYLVNQGDYAVTYNAGDRTNKYVTVTTAEWSMPIVNNGTNGRILLQDTTDYPNRFTFNDITY